MTRFFKEKMAKDTYQNLVRRYGLDEGKVNKNLSGCNLHLWHNEEQTIGFELEVSFPHWVPCFRFSLLEKGQYYCGGVSFSEVSSDSLKIILGALEAGKYNIETSTKTGNKTIYISNDEFQWLLSAAPG